MRTGKIHTYVNGRDISNRKGVTIIKRTDKVSYRVVTDNDSWPSRFFMKKEDAWHYITIYEENNPRESRKIYSYAEGMIANYPELKLNHIHARDITRRTYRKVQFCGKTISY